MFGFTCYTFTVLYREPFIFTKGRRKNSSNFFCPILSSRFFTNSRCSRHSFFDPGFYALPFPFSPSA